MTDDSVFSNSNVASPLENTGSRSSIQVNPFAIENIPSIPENTLSNPADKQPSEDNDRQHAHGGSPEFSDSNAISEQGSLDDNSLYEDEPSVDLSIGQRGLSSSSTQSKFRFRNFFHAKSLHVTLAYTDPKCHFIYRV